MQTFTYKGVELDICSGCNLVWLDEGEEKKILAQKDRHWADGIDPVDILLNSGSDSRGSNCAGDSVDLGSILEFVGEAMAHLLDGL